MRSPLWMALAAALAGACAIELPTRGPAPCGGTGQRCCGRFDDAGALTDGCAVALRCVVSNVSGARVCAPCPAGQSLCGGQCVDLAVDPAHCGACDVACGAGSRCAAATDGGAAVCVVVCPAGQTLCGAACVDLARDDAHCGACGRSCEGAVPGALARCAAGVCAQVACVAGRGDCASAPGCETDLRASVEHCGACGRACRFAHAAASCEAGACALGACEAGFADCDGDPSTGCETNLRVDSAACGACGNACVAPAGRSVSCIGGECVVGLSCASGLADCDGDTSNGCEARVATDASNCGACGRVCLLPNAASTCAAGACALNACNTGYGNCDGAAANGCEVTLANDASHCGTCGRPCMFANAAATCAAGACALGVCNGGYGNCDGAAANGCETTLASTNAHCGACGRACAAGQTCVAGACVCAAGQTACGSSCVNTLTSTTNCGGCGAACSAAGGVASCVSGACRITCSAGFGNCDGAAGNGCEVALATAAAHCGACGASCVGAPNVTGDCVSGRCACAAGAFDCNTSRADGCESASPCV